MLKLCLTVILLGCVTQINCENLPVFIWGQKTPSFLPALSQLNGEEFVTLVKSQSDKDTLTVVFVENSLSVEDLSQCKLKTETCFENLRKVQQKTYLTAVEDPVEALEASYGKLKQKSVSLSNDGDLSDKFDAAGSEKLLFVYLEDVESSEDFATHDNLMSKLYNSIASQRENVIAIYTGRHPSFVYAKSLIRKVRDAEAKEEVKEEVKEAAKDEIKHEAQQEAKQETPAGTKKQRVILNDHLIIAFSSLLIGKDEIDIETVTVTINETEKTTVEMNMVAGTHKIGMVLNLSGGTWTANPLYYGEKRAFSSVPISAYNRKSFGCGQFRLSDAATSIYFEDFQIQPLFNPGEGETITVFSDTANDCVGFFSPAILGALFVIAILFMILSCGLTMIMDIRSNDRFDDPKGKTITINAQE